MPRLLGIVDVPVFEPAFTMPGAGTGAFCNISDIPAYRPELQCITSNTYGPITGRFLGVNLDGISDVNTARVGSVNASTAVYKGGKVMARAIYSSDGSSGEIVMKYGIARQTVPRKAGAYPMRLQAAISTEVRMEICGGIWKQSLTPEAGGYVATYGEGFLWTNQTSGRKQVYFSFMKSNGTLASCNAFNVGIGYILQVEARNESWALCNSSPNLGQAAGWTTGPQGSVPDLWSNIIASYQPLGGHPSGVGLYRIKWRNKKFEPGIETNLNGEMERVVYDVPALNVATEVDFAQGVSTNGWLSAWHGGFVTTLITNGLGPTKQRCELVVMDRNMQTYYLLRLIPQTENARQMVAATAGLISFKIDSEGTMWFRAANSTSNIPLQDKVFYSYSPALFFNPRNLDFDLPSINLPCYNTCVPGYI